MSGDTKRIVGTLGPLILAMGGLILQQNCGLKSDIARIEADIREFRSLHLHAAAARQSNSQAVPYEQTSDSPGSL